MLSGHFGLVWQLHITAATNLNDLSLSFPSLFLLPTYYNCCTKLFSAPVDTRTPLVLPWKKLRHKIRFYFPSFFRILLFSSTDSLLSNSLTLRWRQKTIWCMTLLVSGSSSFVGLCLIIVWFRNVNRLMRDSYPLSFTQDNIYSHVDGFWCEVTEASGCGRQRVLHLLIIIMCTCLSWASALCFHLGCMWTWVRSSNINPELHLQSHSLTCAAGGDGICSRGIFK